MKHSSFWSKIHSTKITWGSLPDSLGADGVTPVANPYGEGQATATSDANGLGKFVGFEAKTWWIELLQRCQLSASITTAELTAATNLVVDKGNVVNQLDLTTFLNQEKKFHLISKGKLHHLLLKARKEICQILQKRRPKKFFLPHSDIMSERTSRWLQDSHWRCWSARFTKNG